MNETTLLSIIVFLPAVAALVLAFAPKSAEETVRYVTFAVTVVVFALTCYGFLFPSSPIYFEHLGEAAANMQSAFSVSWIPSFDIYYYMGLDGISFPLVMLTALVSMLAMGASWSITKHVKAYCVLFLLLETGMLGVFMALDFFLFYVFWEVMLLPMYFLIGVWGGPRREYAAIKFFLYTLVGSVLMLIAILMLYFTSDLRAVASASDLYGNQEAAVSWSRLHIHPDVTDRLAAGYFQNTSEHDVHFAVTAAEENEETSAAWDAESGAITITAAKDATAADYLAAVGAIEGIDEIGSLSDEAPDEGEYVAVPGGAAAEVHTFNLLALAAMGQHTKVFSDEIQWWCFVLLFIGFAIKVPSIPVHTWLPDAHVEAPTPISMILAGVLLKMGGYGILRICYPICPHGGYELATVICWIGVASMVYGAFAALAQTDFKRMVAYSSVSHMGYVVLGLGVWSAQADHQFVADYWNQGVQGAMFQMIGHGISSAGMFFMVGIIYDRVHHRNLNEFGGLFGKMPFYTAMAMGLFFAGLGLPGLCGFIGEVFVVLSVYQFNFLMAVISAAVVVLTAAYILWALQRVYLGSEYKGPHEEDITPTNLRERSIGVALLALAIIFGVFPYQVAFKYMDPTITRQVEELADWTKRVKAVEEAEELAEGEEEETPAANEAAALVPHDNGPSDLSASPALSNHRISSIPPAAAGFAGD